MENNKKKDKKKNNKPMNYRRRTFGKSMNVEAAYRNSGRINLIFLERCNLFFYSIYLGHAVVSFLPSNDFFIAFK